MNTRLGAIVCLGLFLQCTCSAQVSSRPPRNWTQASVIELGLSFSRLKLSQNAPEIIRQEILDTNTLRLIATYSGLTDKDLATVRVSQEPGFDWVQVYQLGKS